MTDIACRCLKTHRAWKAVVVTLLCAVGAGYALLGNADSADAAIYGSPVDDTLTTDTNMNYALDIGGGKSITVNSQTYLDTENGLRVFDWLVNNNSGDTLFSLKFTGQDYIGGFGVNQTWSTDIQDSTPADPENDFIRFYDNLLDNIGQEEFLAGSELTDTWGKGSFLFKGEGGDDFYLQGLKPTTVPEPATLALALLGAGVMLRKRGSKVV